MKKSLDTNLREDAIISAIPIGSHTVIDAGCGDGHLSYALKEKDYTVIGFDIWNSPEHQPTEWTDNKPTIIRADLLDLGSFLLYPADVVICTEVLEHLPDTELACKNLMRLSRGTIIVTVPREYSYSDPDHRHHWGDKSIECFHQHFSPMKVTIREILHKKEDAGKQSGYLIIATK